MRFDYEVIDRALRLATEHHEGIFRKYEEPPQPYIEHPKRCALRFSRLNFGEPDRTIGIAVMLVHDTLEDKRKDGTMLSFDELASSTSREVADGTQELTNPSKDSPLPRPDRKLMDRLHIAVISIPGKLRKMIDRTDNLNQLLRSPRDFRRLYLKESEQLLDAIGDVYHEDYSTLRLEYLVAMERVKTSLIADQYLRMVKG